MYVYIHVHTCTCIICMYMYMYIHVCNVLISLYPPLSRCSQIRTAFSHSTTGVTRLASFRSLSVPRGIRPSSSMASVSTATPRKSWSLHPLLSLSTWTKTLWLVFPPSPLSHHSHTHTHSHTHSLTHSLTHTTHTHTHTHTHTQAFLCKYYTRESSTCMYIHVPSPISLQYA